LTSKYKYLFLFDFFINRQIVASRNGLVWARFPCQLPGSARRTRVGQFPAVRLPSAGGAAQREAAGTGSGKFPD
jgi:hypothetical protein